MAADCDPKDPPETINNLGDMACVVTSQLKDFAELFIGLSYISGIACVINSLFKFKQHKDNPTQIPITTPITVLFIGVFLVYLPSIIITASTSLFGTGETSGGAFGTGIDQLRGN